MRLLRPDETDYPRGIDTQALGYVWAYDDNPRPSCRMRRIGAPGMNGAEDQDHGPPRIYAIRKAATPLELEVTLLEMLAFLTAAWLLLGGAGAGLTIAYAGTLWGLLWFIPCAVFALSAIRQLIRVGRMVNSDNGKH